MDAFNAAYSKLRGTGSLTNYKRCVLSSLEKKRIKINVALLRIWVNNFPKVRDGATSAVLKSATERVLQVLRVLAYTELDDCPLAVRAVEVYRSEARELLRKLLSSQHTLNDLIPYRNMYNNEFMDADLKASYESAFNSAAQAAGMK